MLFKLSLFVITKMTSFRLHWFVALLYCSYWFR